MINIWLAIHHFVQSETKLLIKGAALQRQAKGAVLSAWHSAPEHELCMAAAHLPQPDGISWE